MASTGTYFPLSSIVVLTRLPLSLAYLTISPRLGVLNSFSSSSCDVLALGSKKLSCSSTLLSPSLLPYLRSHAIYFSLAIRPSFVKFPSSWTNSISGAFNSPYDVARSYKLILLTLNTFLSFIRWTHLRYETHDFLAKCWSSVFSAFNFSKTG